MKLLHWIVKAKCCHFWLKTVATRKLCFSLVWQIVLIGWFAQIWMRKKPLTVLQNLGWQFYSNGALLLNGFTYLSVIKSLPSPLKAWKPIGIQQRERERQRTNPNNKGMLSITLSRCSLLSLLPVVVCVITPQLKCLCLWLWVCAPCSPQWPHSTMLTMWPEKNSQFNTSLHTRRADKTGDLYFSSLLLRGRGGAKTAF